VIVEVVLDRYVEEEPHVAVGDPVVDLAAGAGGSHQSRQSELPKLVTGGRFGGTDGLSDIAYPHLSRLEQRVDDSQPSRIRQQFESRGQVLGVFATEAGVFRFLVLGVGGHVLLNILAYMIIYADKRKIGHGSGERQRPAVAAIGVRLGEFTNQAERRQDMRRPGASIEREGVMRRVRTIGLLALLVLVLAGCAAGANPGVGTTPDGGNIAGFWLGLWQGVIVPITFVISLFNDGVNVYEVYNTGNWYNFGFVLGAVFLIGGSHGARSAK